MRVVKTQGAAEKLGPIAFGRHLVAFKIKNCDRQFTVHEDLLCANSVFFKDKLQKDRKAVEGECTICHEDLDPRVGDITFCRAQCGQNIHLNCLSEWRKSHPPGPLKCPMCREVWKLRATGDVISVSEEEKLDPKAVQMYIDWLYSGKVLVDNQIERGNDDYSIELLKSWKVSSVLRDINFRYALIAKYYSSVDDFNIDGFWYDAIEYVYEVGKVDSMREFVVDDFLISYVSDVWSPDWTSSVPDSFLRDLGIASMRSEMKQMTHKMNLERHTRGHYTLEDEYGDSEDIDGDGGDDA